MRLGYERKNKSEAETSRRKMSGKENGEVIDKGEKRERP